MFPKDLAALVQTGERVGYPFQIAEAAAKVNYEQHLRMVAKITRGLRRGEGKNARRVGTSFKPNTNDMREAPSLTILSKLMKTGRRFAPMILPSMEESSKLFPGMVPCQDTYDVAEGAAA